MEIVEHRDCPICGGRFDIISTNDWGRRMARCRDCDHVFVQNPLPWNVRLNDFQGMSYFDGNYRHQGITSPEDDAQWTAWIKLRLGDIAPLLRKGPLRIAEVGCLEGRMLAGLAAQGHQVCGCDLNVEIVERSRKHLGLDIRAGTVGQCLPLWGEMDAMLAIHVLHFTACPLSALAEWLRLLRPKGQALIVLPLEHRDHGYHLCLHYFSRRSIGLLAEALLPDHTLRVHSSKNTRNETEYTAFLLGERRA